MKSRSEVSTCSLKDCVPWFICDFYHAGGPVELGKLVN